jgi:hypothetical protein
VKKGAEIEELLARSKKEKSELLKKQEVDVKSKHDEKLWKLFLEYCDKVTWLDLRTCHETVTSRRQSPRWPSRTS